MTDEIKTAELTAEELEQVNGGWRPPGVEPLNSGAIYGAGDFDLRWTPGPLIIDTK